MKRHGLTGYKSLRLGMLTFIIFTALHAMQMLSSDENSVCPSVKRVHCDKTKELAYLSRFLYHTKDHLA